MSNSASPLACRRKVLGRSWRREWLMTWANVHTHSAAEWQGLILKYELAPLSSSAKHSTGVCLGKSCAGATEVVQELIMPRLW